MGEQETGGRGGVEEGEPAAAAAALAAGSAGCHAGPHF